MVVVTCPSCGTECKPAEVERTGRKGPDLDVTVARRSTGFGGDVLSLTELESFAYEVELPCGCTVITVN